MISSDSESRTSVVPMSPKVLCVDDDPDLLKLLSLQLRSQFEVCLAVSADEALSLLNSQGPFAVVVSDLRMPGMNGADFLQQAREICPEMVRILITGDGVLEGVLEAVNKGYIFRCLLKPCSREQVVDAVTAAYQEYNAALMRGFEDDLLEATRASQESIPSEMLPLTGTTGKK